MEGDLLLPLLGRGEGPGVEIQQAWRQTLAWRLGCWWMRVHGTRNTYRLGQRKGAFRAEVATLGQRWALVLLCHKLYNPLFFPGPFATPLEKTFNSLWIVYFLLLGNWLIWLLLDFPVSGIT